MIKMLLHNFCEHYKESEKSWNKRIGCKDKAKLGNVLHLMEMFYAQIQMFTLCITKGAVPNLHWGTYTNIDVHFADRIQIQHNSVWVVWVSNVFIFMLCILRQAINTHIDLLLLHPIGDMSLLHGRVCFIYILSVLYIIDTFWLCHRTIEWLCHSNNHDVSKFYISLCPSGYW